MRIFQPELITRDGQTRLSARVESGKCPVSLPETLWFSVPEEHGRFMNADLNAIVAAALPLAMYLEEDMELEGVLSPRLLRGLHDYMNIQTNWKPTDYKRIRINHDKLEATTPATAERYVATSFSGGVDSAHTLWRHSQDRVVVPNYRISHCIIINGFDQDSDLDRSGHFDNIDRALKPMMQSLGIELVVCATNYMMFSDLRILKQSFGAMVTTPALALGSLLSAFYIPSSYDFQRFVRDGSSTMMDHLLSTESLEVIHDSPEVTRVEKTRILSEWPESYKTLRVCFKGVDYDENTGTLINCCRCEKCKRTMATLEIFDRLDRYPGFPKPISYPSILRTFYGFKFTRLFAREIVFEAFKRRKFRIAFSFLFASIFSWLTYYPRRAIRLFHIYLESRSKTYDSWVHKHFPNLFPKARRIRR